MVDSGIGRTDLAQLGQGRPEPRRPAEPEVGGLPLRQSAEGGLGEPQCAEEPCTFTAFKASRERHTPSWRFCVKNRRTKWSAVTAARRRIESRSPGKTKSALRTPPGP